MERVGKEEEEKEEEVAEAEEEEVQSVRWEKKERRRKSAGRDLSRTKMGEKPGKRENCAQCKKTVRGQ